VGHPGVKDLVHAYVLNDFAKDERPWVEAVCAVMADNAELLAKGEDASFQNKVHLGMQAKGFLQPTQPRDPDERHARRKSVRATSWALNAASSASLTSASRRSSTP